MFAIRGIKITNVICVDENITNEKDIILCVHDEISLEFLDKRRMKHIHVLNKMYDLKSRRLDFIDCNEEITFKK